MAQENNRLTLGRDPSVVLDDKATLRCSLEVSTLAAPGWDWDCLVSSRRRISACTTRRARFESSGTRSKNERVHPITASLSSPCPPRSRIDAELGRGRGRGVRRPLARRDNRGVHSSPGADRFLVGVMGVLSMAAAIESTSESSSESLSDGRGPKLRYCRLSIKCFTYIRNVFSVRSRLRRRDG
jgi:hypothetical protein